MKLQIILSQMLILNYLVMNRTHNGSSYKWPDPSQIAYKYISYIYKTEHASLSDYSYMNVNYF